MAQKANSSATRISYLVQDTPGVIPATPEWKRLRVTGESIEFEAESKTSEELDPSRNVADSQLASGKVSGGCKFEFSDGSFEDIMSVGVGGSWDDDVLINGTEEHSLALECTYEMGVTDIHKRVTQSYINGMSFDFKPGQFIGGDFDILGTGGSFYNAIVAGATYVAPNDEPAMMASTEFGSMVLAGLTFDTLSSLSLKWVNNLRPRYALNGSIDPESIGWGQFVCTGEMEFYLTADKLPLITAAMNDTATGIEFLIGQTTEKKTMIELPRVKLGRPRIVAEGQNNDVMIRCAWSAHRSADLAGNTIRITRNVE